MKLRNPPFLRTPRVFFSARVFLLITIVAGLIVVVARNNVSRSAASTAGSTLSEMDKSKIADRYGQLELSFEKNQGQADQRVKFLSRGRGYDLFLTASDTVLALRKPQRQSAEKPSETNSASNPIHSTAQEASVLRLSMIGANPVSSIEGEDELSGKVNYLIGNNAEKWHTNIPTYRKVRYREVYPGVDVVYYGNQRQLEYDFVVAPGRNPEVIKFKLEGADRISLDETGDLQLRVKDGDVRLHRPFIYQLTDAGERREVRGEYVIKGKEIGFKVRAFDSRKPLIIDPILSYATLLGAGGNDIANGIAIDSQGNAYVTGVTTSTNFPTTPGAFKTIGSFGGAFITKMNATGTSLVYSTYLGGDSQTTGKAIAVDSSGNAYVTGFTSSTNFPTVNALKTRKSFFKSTDGAGSWNNDNTGLDLDINKIAVAPSAPNTLYAGTFSGPFVSTDGGATWQKTPTTGLPAFPNATALAVDPNNPSVVYAGMMNGGLFKTTNGGNSWSAVNIPLGFSTVTTIVFDPVTPSTIYVGSTGVWRSTDSGSSWTALNNFGTPSVPSIRALAIDPNTPSTIYAGTFSNGLFKTTNGGTDWTAMNAGMTGSFANNIAAIAIDPFNTSTLYTGHGSSGFSGAIHKSTNGGTSWDPVNTGVPNKEVSALIADRTTPSKVYAATIGGGVIVTTNGGTNWINANVGLWKSNVPALVSHPTNSSILYAGTTGSTVDTDAFVCKLNPSGSALLFSSFLGGSQGDFGHGIALDAAGNVYVAGQTTSTNFPAVNAIKSTLAAEESCPADGFVTKLNLAGPSIAFSTYLGGNKCEAANAIATDAAGDVYVTGLTTSTDFPLANAFQSTIGDQFNGDAFATKFSTTGSLIYSTYLGGDGTDRGNGIAVDASGNAHVTGITTSTNYPTANAFQSTNGGAAGDVFVTKLNNLGSGLVYSTYLGGSNVDIGRGIAVDAAGNAYVAGLSSSLEFPLVAGAIRTNSPMFKSINGAANWNNDNYGLRIASIRTVAVNPIQPSTIYLGTAGGGVFKSTNGGKTWAPINNGLSNLNVTELVVDPVTPSRVYVATNNSFVNDGIYRSIDSGNSWTKVNTGLANTNVLTLAIDPVSPMTLYAGTFGSQIFKTIDGADNWAPSGNPSVSFAGAIAVDPLNHTTVYASDTVSDGGVFKSTDSGATWESVGSTPVRPRGVFLSVSPLTPGLVYVASTFGGLFKSVDGGVTWTLARTEGGKTVFDPVNASTHYLVSSQEGVLKSVNGGQTWVPMNKGLGSPVASALAINPANPSILHVAASAGGGNNIFATKINPSGSALIYSTFIAGEPVGESSGAGGEATGIAIDSVGNAYVTGTSGSPDFTVSPDSYQPFNRGFTDVFLAKLTMSHIISGQVLDGSAAPVNGAEVVLTDGSSVRSVFTESDGSYEFARLPDGGSFTVSASKPAFTMAPASQTFNNLTGNQTLNFTATPTNAPFFTISGQVTENGVGLAGATVTLSGSQPGLRTTDSSGTYSFTLAGGGNYTVTPSLLGFTFTASSLSFNNLSSNQTGNFAATRQNFVVTNNNDHGTGSLRQAMLNANATAGVDTITFNIPGSGIHVIDLQVALPEITDPVVIDATTQPGYAGSPLIELNGLGTSGGEGFVVHSGNTTIRGFALGRFDIGIWLRFSDNNVIQGNYIGLDATGNVERPNSAGILLSGSSHNLIGGLTPSARNVISSSGFDGLSLNGSNNVVQGNFIGTNGAGTAARPNGINGITISGSPDFINNLIGGTAPGAGNLISGNQTGLRIDTASNIVQGNLIGTDVTGTSKVPNATGIHCNFGADNLIGGLTPAARNIISGNNGDGLTFGGTGSRLQGNFIGTDITGTVALGNGGSGVVAGNTGLIGGTTPEARNVISGNGGFGNISLGSNSSGSAAVVQGNYIGTDVTGNIALSEGGFGITIFSVNNVIGGTVPGAANVISGNRIGIQIGGFTTAEVTGNVVQGNIIGLNALGTTPLPNTAEGINFSSASNNTVGGIQGGAANRISFNGGAGVVAVNGNGNVIRGNSIFSNGGLGIDLSPLGVSANDPGDLDSGANLHQNFPLLTSVVSNGGNTTIQGTLNSKPNTQFQIDFYSNASCDISGNGEGGQFFNSTAVTTDGNGDATINVTFPMLLESGRTITATATDPQGNTSEFSPCDSNGAAGSLQFTVSSRQVIEDVGSIAITVVRQGGSSGSLTVDFSTANGTATAGEDYASTSGTLTFNNGETSKSFQVQIHDDATTEQDETFTIRLQNASSLVSLGVPNIQTVTIQDRTTIPVLSVNSVNVVEGDSGTTDATFTVTLSAATARSISVNYATSNGTATGGATCGQLIDYETKSGTLSFPPGESSQTVVVKICGDTSAEATETFLITLSNPSNATLLFDQGLGRIFNNDTLLLVLDESGPAANQAAALESQFAVRDPFQVPSIADWLNLGSDSNTRVTLFAQNLQLNQGEPESAVSVILIDSNGLQQLISAEDVRALPNTPYTQVSFRLPNNLPSGACQVRIRAHGLNSNIGTIRIKQP